MRKLVNWNEILKVAMLRGNGMCNISSGSMVESRTGAIGFCRLTVGEMRGEGVGGCRERLGG